MDVSKFQVDGAWLELELESDKIIGPLKLKIKPLSAAEQIEYGRIAAENRDEYLKKIYDLVLEWNLTNNGQPVPCDEKNRELYLKYLVPLSLKQEKKQRKEILADQDKDKEEEEPKVKMTVGLAMFNFAKDFTNFVKN